LAAKSRLSSPAMPSWPGSASHSATSLAPMWPWCNASQQTWAL
jgi:hypothetical protein